MGGGETQAAAAVAPQELYYDDWGTGSNVAVNNPASQEYAAALAAQLAQQMPPPQPGSLQELMKNPMMLQMLGSVQGVDSDSENMNRLELAARKGGAYVNLSPGSGQQFQQTITPLYAQAQQQRGKPSPGLGMMLRGGGQ